MRQWKPMASRRRLLCAPPRSKCGSRSAGATRITGPLSRYRGSGNKRVICRGEISSTVKRVALNFFSFFFFGTKLFNHRRRQSNSLENQVLPVGSRLEREFPCQRHTMRVLILATESRINRSPGWNAQLPGDTLIKPRNWTICLAATCCLAFAIAVPARGQTTRASKVSSEETPEQQLLPGVVV